jgi:hypothetical protein
MTTDSGKEAPASEPVRHTVFKGCERCGEPCGGEKVCGTCLAIEAEKAKQ